MLGERQKTVISLQFVKIDGKEKKKDFLSNPANRTRQSKGRYPLHGLACHPSPPPQPHDFY